MSQPFFERFASGRVFAGGRLGARRREFCAEFARCGRQGHDSSLRPIPSAFFGDEAFASVQVHSKGTGRTRGGTSITFVK